MKVIKDIQTEPLKPVYIIHGTERHWQHKVYQALQQRAYQDGFGDWNWRVLQADKEFSVSTLLTELAGTAWGAGNKIVVLKNADQVNAQQLETLVEWLKANQTGYCLALFFEKLDGRLKAVKALKKLGEEVNCQSLEGESLTRFVSDKLSLKGKTIQRKALTAFIDRVGSNLELINQEVEKLLLFVSDHSEITLSDVEQITSLAPEQLESGAIFRLTDAIACKNKEEALRVLHELIDGGEVPLRILPLIERQLRLLLAAKCNQGIPLAQAAKLMGESSEYPLKKIIKYAKNFSADQLYSGFYHVIQTDRGMKLGGNGEFLLEQLIVRLCTQ